MQHGLDSVPTESTRLERVGQMIRLTERVVRKYSLRRRRATIGSPQTHFALRVPILRSFQHTSDSGPIRKGIRVL